MSTPGRNIVREWQRFRLTYCPKMGELVFQAFLAGVKVGQANPKAPRPRGARRKEGR